MSEYVPTFNFETLPDGTLRVTDNSIQDAVFDAIKRLADAKEAALKEAIKSLGWIAPEDIAAHDARIASEAAERAWDEGFTRGFYSGQSMRSDADASESPVENPYRADRIRAEREGATQCS